MDSAQSVSTLKAVRRMVDSTPKLDHFTWNSFQINGDTVSSWHRGKGNIGTSLFTGLGNYSGGNLLVRGHGPLCVFEMVVLFKGKISHSSESFLGRSWSLVLFSHEAVARLDAKGK